MKIALMFGLLIAASVAAKQPENFQPSSTWDEGLLNVKLHKVHINADNMTAAWQEMGTKYLLRANFFMGDMWNSNTAKFSFQEDEVSEGTLLKAFLDTYPAYTFTHDDKTGVIWIHPKNIQYGDILKQKINVETPIFGKPMYTGVLGQLGRALSADISIFGMDGSQYGLPLSRTYDYSMDLPAGNCSIKDILNHCCAYNITKSFAIYPGGGNKPVVEPVNLFYANPLHPREAAVYFWESELGEPTNDVPSIDELVAAMGNDSPQKRWAAENYWEAVSGTAPPGKLIARCSNPKQAIWAALAMGAVLFRGEGDHSIKRFGPIVTTNLTQIEDPGLALVASLELASEKQDTGYLDSIVNKHKYTDVEIENIKPDVYRLCHESKLALDKLRYFHLNTSDFSPESLREIENTNLVSLVPKEKK